MTNDTVNQISPTVSPDEEWTFPQRRAYAGDMLYTEGMTGDHMYVIKDGEVDLYLMREEKRVVVATLGKGDCFGMMPQLLNSRRTTNAVAKCYCEFYVIDSYLLVGLLEQTPKLVRSILTSMAQRISTANELIATRVNYQPELNVYAQLLHLVGMADIGGRKAVASLSGNPQNHPMATPTLSEVMAHARAMLGHSDTRIRHAIATLVSLHLAHIETEKGDSKRVCFNPVDIVARARKLTRTHKDQSKLDYEYLSVDEFSSLVEVDRAKLLNKLAKSEFADDLFNFRKSEVMRLLNEKGKKYFYERKIKKPEEFTDIADIEFADANSVHDVLARFDAYDLSKVLSCVEEESTKAKILSGLPRAKREEVLEEVGTLENVDPIEAGQIGQRIITKLIERMTKGA